MDETQAQNGQQPAETVRVKLNTGPVWDMPAWMAKAIVEGCAKESKPLFRKLISQAMMGGAD